MVGLGHYKWYQSRSPTSMWGSVLFGPIGGVYLFGIIIPWDTMRTLCLHRGCLSHPTLDRGETS